MTLRPIWCGNSEIWVVINAIKKFFFPSFYLSATRLFKAETRDYYSAHKFSHKVMPNPSLTLPKFTIFTLKFNKPRQIASTAARMCINLGNDLVENASLRGHGFLCKFVRLIYGSCRIRLHQTHDKLRVSNWTQQVIASNYGEFFLDFSLENFVK